MRLELKNDLQLRGSRENFTRDAKGNNWAAVCTLFLYAAVKQIEARAKLGKTAAQRV